MKRLLNILKSPLFWLFAALVLPDLAYAADPTSLFTIPPGDLSKKYIDKLFNVESGPFGPILGVINASAMILMGFILSYALTHSILTASAEGNLGKKYGTHWYAMRVFAASALAMPVKGGVSLIFYFVVFIFYQSVGLADQIYIAANSSNANVAYITNPINHDKAKELMVGMFKMSACAAALQKTNLDYKAAYGTDLSGWTTFGKTPEFGFTPVDTGYALQLLYGNISDVNQMSACGRIVLTDPNIPVDSNLGNSNPQVVALQQISKNIFPAKKAALLKANKTVSDAAVAYLANKTPVLPAINKAISDYEVDVRNAVTAQVTNSPILQNISKAQTNQGWIVIGSTYLHQINTQNSINSIIGNLPSVKVGEGMNSINDDASKLEMLSVEAELEREEIAPENLTLHDAANADQNDTNADNGSWWGLVRSPMSHFAHSASRNLMNGNVFSGSESNSPNLLLSSAALGGKCLDFADTLLVIPIAIAVVPVLGSASPALSNTIMMITGPLIILGLTLSVWLPFMPYLISLGVILSIVISFCTAAIGGSFWCISMLLSGGSEEMGNGENGAKLLFGLFLQAPLFVVATLLSMSILSIGSDFLYSTLNDTRDMIVGSSITVWGTLGYLVVVAAAMHTVVTLSFSVMYSFGDSVCEYLGLNIRSQISGHAEHIKQNSQGHHSTVVGGVVNMGQTAGRGLTEMGMEKKAKKNQQIDYMGGMGGNNSGKYEPIQSPQDLKADKSSNDQDPSKK